MKNSFIYDMPIGKILISDNGIAITEISFSAKPDKANVRETLLTKLAAKQLLEYFDGKRTTFDLPLAPQGTPFQLSVWAALCEIPYGVTKSYKQIAESIGNVKACRAVGMANNRNQIGIVVPCHRVIGVSGALTGYAGGLKTKKFLLDLESKK